MKDKLLLAILNQLERLLRWLEKGQAIYGRNVYKSNLRVRQVRNGKLILERNLGDGLVTNAGVALLAADWTNVTATLKQSNWHDSGTGITAPTISDTTMQTPTGNARLPGAQSNVSNVYQTVATLTYGTALAITEWGLFTAVSSGTMWDHRTFTAINCVGGDTIQFTYQLTVVSGG
jgi:hypothetical protein